MAPTTNRSLKVLLQFLLDQQSFQKTDQGVKTLDKNVLKLQNDLDSLNKQAFRTQLIIGKIGEVAEGASKKFGRMFLGGAGIVGGVLAVAQNYVNNAKESTEITREWWKETNKLNQAQEKIGATVAREALPIMRQVADLAEKASAFVESHPELVKAAINTGLVVATLGAVGVAVTKGIKFVADVTYIATVAQQFLAAKLMNTAADKQLAAAGAANLSGGQIAQNLRGAFGLGGAAAGTAGGISAGAVLAVVTTILAGAGIGALIYDKIIAPATGNARLNTIATGGAYLLGRGFGNVAGLSEEENERKAIVFAGLIGKLTHAIDENSPLWTKAVENVKKVGNQLTEVITQLAGSQFEQQIVSAFTQMQEADKQATQDYTRAKLEIVRQAQQREVELSRQHYRAQAKIAEDYRKSIESITTNYQKANKTAEFNYANDRAKIIQGSGLEIERMEKDHQERLRKLAMEHRDRVEDLVNNRDALGLRREMRDYQRKRAEETRDTNIEIGRRRQDLAIRLRDLEASFAAERAQRLAEYNAQLKEALVIRNERLKQQAEAYREELRQLKAAKEEQLRTLKIQYDIERQRRRDAFLAYVRDLDASLLGEQNKKRQYYAAMLQDVESFLASYRSKLPSGGASASSRVTTRDHGGYATTGIYGLAMDGRTEFVLDGPTTRAAEASIGGSLSQANIARALGGRGGGGNVYVSYGRIDANVTPAQVRQITRATIEEFGRIVN